MSRYRYTADSITDDALDALYENATRGWRRGDEWKAKAQELETDRDRIADELDELREELGARDDEARERWIQKQLDETGLKAMDFRNGMSMEIEPAREMVAHWVGAARAMLGDAPNYSETPIEMEVKIEESPERFAFVLQRVGKLTPHQARQQAEQRAAQAEAALRMVLAVAEVIEANGLKWAADSVRRAAQTEESSTA